MDEINELASLNLRNDFVFPSVQSIRQTALKDNHGSNDQSDEKASSLEIGLESNSPCVYMIGNSLGLQPKNTRKLLNEELDVWSERYDIDIYNKRFSLLCPFSLKEA